MEATPLPTADADHWVEHFGQSLHTQRERVREFLAAQHGRLQRAEAELGKQLQQIAQELAKSRGETSQAREEIQQRAEHLAQEAEAVERLREEVAAHQEKWESLQRRASEHQQALAEEVHRQQDDLDHRRDELVKRQAEIDQSQAEVHRDRQTLHLARQEHEAEREQLRTWRESLDAKQAELGQQREQLDAQAAQTENQRRRIARELKAQRAAQLKEIQKLRAELKQQDIDEQAQRGRDLEAARDHARELATELEAVRAECEELQRELSEQPVQQGADAEELRDALAQRDALRARLTETEGRLAEAQSRLASAAEGDDENEQRDYQRRYELAMEDLRELKTRNEQLQKRLNEASSASTTGSVGAGVLDWETEKQRILSALESDHDEDDEEEADRRLTIEGVMQTTDQVLLEKDREIGELKQLLESQSNSVGSVAVGANAVGDLFDKDAVIQEERESLKRLQEEWKEKRRQAEIALSVERAEIARGRAEIESKLRALEKQSKESGSDQGGSAESDQPVRGRWLARLGLRDPEKHP
ncbi:MAG: hypothetical protein A2V70_07825 [Planctomycetes bacterium RBG_13_63_9]|nr:MAG: hypothetical protein A2V70_07825 [Planctomycetes bacterium RBG_13_63_9]